MDSSCVSSSSSFFLLGGGVQPEDGQVFAWGEGEWGRLGLGYSQSSRLPSLVEALDGRRIVQVSAGSTHSGALTGFSIRFFFLLLFFLFPIECPFSIVSAPFIYIFIEIDTIADGNLFLWGRNDSFQLGSDSSGNYFGGAGFDAENFPRELRELREISGGRSCVRFSCGARSTAAVMDDGTLYYWGNKQIYEPRLVTFDDSSSIVPIADVICGTNAVYAIGRAYICPLWSISDADYFFSMFTLLSPLSFLFFVCIYVPFFFLNHYRRRWISVGDGCE